MMLPGWIVIVCMLAKNMPGPGAHSAPVGCATAILNCSLVSILPISPQATWPHGPDGFAPVSDGLFRQMAVLGGSISRVRS